MTNFAPHDPEVLEFRFPVRLESYEIRQGSGRRGPASGGRRRGAAGSLSRSDDRSILSNGRHSGAFGMAAVRREGRGLNRVRTRERPG